MDLQPFPPDRAVARFAVSNGRGPLLCALLLLTLPAHLPAGDTGSPENEIRMFANAFVPPVRSVRAGETVTWTWVEGEHLVTSGVSSRPEDNPGELFEGRVDEAHPTFSHRFGEPGEFNFFDALNENGLVGTITVLTDAMDFPVRVVDNDYLPADVAIFEGDTVEWQHDPMEAFHTVTSGASSQPEDNPGALFDAESSDARPLFRHTFDTPMFVPYFCRPHEQLGMKGTVLVQRKFIRGDFNLDGTIDITDPILILEALFLRSTEFRGCLDAADFDDNGSVEVNDPVGSLFLQFAGGVVVPPPYPAPGPDRTDDDLRCMP